jgi:hypothetical protein
MSQIKQYKTVALALLTAWALQEHHELVALKLVFVMLVVSMDVFLHMLVAFCLISILSSISIVDSIWYYLFSPQHCLLLQLSWSLAS